MSEPPRSTTGSTPTPTVPCLSGLILGLACNWAWPWPTAPYRYALPAGILLAALAGLSVVILNNVWLLLTILPTLIAIHYVVVLKEEVDLEDRFGDAYREYKSRVRRWL